MNAPRLLAAISNSHLTYTRLTRACGAGLCAVGCEQNAEGQRQFCHHQLKNDKTRRLLEASMGAQWTERYMTEILFDSP